MSRECASRENADHIDDERDGDGDAATEDDSEFLVPVHERLDLLVACE